MAAPSPGRGDMCGAAAAALRRGWPLPAAGSLVAHRDWQPPARSVPGPAERTEHRTGTVTGNRQPLSY